MSRGPAQPLWIPSAERNRNANFTKYLAWLAQHRGLRFDDYHSTWQWSATHIEDFWASILDYFAVRATQPYRQVLDTRVMPGARWFDGVELNYAEHAFVHARDDSPAICYQSELRPLRAMSWNELRTRVAALAASMRELGIMRGDRVAAVLPNCPEAVIVLLACASIGAIFCSCSPEFGVTSISERFAQIEPKLLFTVDGYSYSGKQFERIDTVPALQRTLPTVQHVVLVPYLDEAASLAGTLSWSDLIARDAGLGFDPVPFNFPLWILFSSGSTGPPKAIVHGHGGIVLEHLKSIVIQNDLSPGDAFFWHTTTGWMMWNVLVSGLLAGCTIVLYDGSPAHPDLDVLWRLAQDARVTRFGAGAAFYTACMKAGITPRSRYDLGALRAIGSTGSPLPPEAFRWLYDAVKRDVWLASSSGGTEIASAFLGGCPLLPVYEGELQGAALGVRAAAYNERGESVINTTGELVIEQPLPSMPLFLWGDEDGSRYRDSYFTMYPGVWRHGDWVQFNERGGVIIHGRSDATLNRGGVRIGSSEIYRAVESIDGVLDSLVVGLERADGSYFMPLFVVLERGRTLDAHFREQIARRIRTECSPRHVPDDIVQVDALPRTRNGKKLEVPVKRILLGEDPDIAIGTADTTHPEPLAFFVDYRSRVLSSTTD